MTIHEKVVTRYEVTCDDCGEFLGEYGDIADARYHERRHQTKTHPKGPRSSRMPGATRDS